MTPDEFKKCLNKKSQKAAVRVARNQARLPNFQVGDVIVGYRKNGGLIMQNDNMIQRWAVVHIDEFGIMFAKKMGVNGNLGKGVYCLAEDPIVDKFELDPDFLDLVLLGREDEYNPAKTNRDMAKKRSQLRRENDKRKVKWKDVVEAQKIINTWTEGDTLYYSRTNTPNDTHITPCTISKIDRTEIDYSVTKEQTHSWSSVPSPGFHYSERAHRHHRLSHKIIIIIRFPDGSTRSLEDSTTYTHGWYHTRPLTVQELT